MRRTIARGALGGGLVLLIGGSAATSCRSWSSGSWSCRPPDSPTEGPLVTLVNEDLPPRGTAPAGAPNLVLVIGCTVRQDQTSIYGGPPETTPFLASLAAEGARLADPITAAPWTRAASTAILTGHHPIRVGMAEPLDSRDERVLPPEVTTLAEHLRANGYATIGVTTNPNLNRVYGFDQGFERYRQLAKLWRDDGAKTPGPWAVADALRLVDELPGEVPFYLQVVLIDAHAPFVSDPEDLEPFAQPGLPEEVTRYRASLRALDHAVRLLDEGLRERGYDPGNTVFVFTNDHGEGLSWPAHHGASHGRYLAPSSVGGVVVARGPGIAPGRVVGGVVSQVDLAPTLVGLLGLPPLAAEGVDGSAALRGPADVFPRDRAYTETWFKDVDRAAIYTPDRACQLDLDDAPLPQRGPVFVDGCFDRRADPLHTRPFRDEALEAALRAWRADGVAAAARLGEVDRIAPDDGTNAQLEALGYTTRE